MHRLDYSLVALSREEKYHEAVYPVLQLLLSIVNNSGKLRSQVSNKVSFLKES